MTPKIKWKNIPQKYGSDIEVAIVGRVNVGFARWSAFRSKDDPPSYDYHCSLPSIKKEVASGKVSTMQEAKDNVEKLIQRWFVWIEEEDK